MPHKDTRSRSESYDNLKVLQRASHNKNRQTMQRAEYARTHRPPEPEEPKAEAPVAPVQQMDMAPYGGPLSGDSSLIFLLMVVLLILVFWKTIVTPVLDVAWTPGSKHDVASLPWKKFLLGLVFVVVVTFISSINDAAYGLMILFVGAMYVVYVIETQGGAVTGLVSWANGPTQQNTNLNFNVPTTPAVPANTSPTPGSGTVTL